MKNQKDFFKSILITSPIIAAVVISLVFAVNLAANPKPQATFQPSTTTVATTTKTTNPTTQPGQTTTTPPPPTTTQPTVLTAASLFAEFTSNQPAATAKYLNKVIQVQGKVTAWGTVSIGDWVSLDVGNGVGGILGQVKPPKVFAEAEITTYVGQTVTIIGTCKGMVGSQVVIDDISSPQLPIVSK